MIQFEKPSVEQFFKTYTIERFAVSADEKCLVFSTNLSGKFNLWGMDLPHQFPYPLTFVDQSCDNLLYDKQGRFIVAGFDLDGDENTQLYALPLHGGNLKSLRVEKGERFFLNSLSDNGEKLYYSSTKGNRHFLNSYSYDLVTGKEELLLKGEVAATYIFDVSPNENSYLYIKHFSNSHSLAYVRKGGEDIIITPPTPEKHTVSHAIFVSEQDVYMITNYEEDFSYLAAFNLESRKFTKIQKFEGEELLYTNLDKEHKLIYLVSSKGVRDNLYQYNIRSGETLKIETPVSEIQHPVIGQRGSLFLLGRTATQTSNIYQLSLGSNEWKEITCLRVPGVANAEQVEPEIIIYSSFDGVEIEGLLYIAKKEVSNGHLILWPHGGPQAAERETFKVLFQFLLNSGYSIFAPNFRGSTGYGLKFKKMVERDWGGGVRLDLIEGLEWLIKNGYADRDKIFVMGASYGGYMALLLVGRHPEYFKACIDCYGPSNLFSLIESMPDHWKPQIEQWIGDPKKDKKKLNEDSPITYLSNMTKPILVVQGANDPRVVKSESDQIVESLRRKGRHVEYIVLEDEGHGFSKKENEIKVYRKVLEFLDSLI